MNDPKETRMIQTRDGVERIPRTQIGIPLKEYLRNTDFPENLDRAVVYTTSSGPVALEPDPVAWTETHDEKVREYAEAVKNTIDEKGYYKKTLDNYANRLSTDTGYPQSEMKAMIVSTFDATNGQDPFDYLQGVRAAKGLPVREREAEPAQNQEPEM